MLQILHVYTFIHISKLHIYMNSMCLHFVDAKVFIIRSTSMFLSLFICNRPNAESRSPVIVDLKYVLILRIELNERSQDADVAGMVSKTLSMVYTLGYASRLVWFNASSRIDGRSPAIAHLVFHRRISFPNACPETGRSSTKAP